MKEEKKDFWKLPSVIEFTKKSKTSLWVTGIFLLAVYGIKVFNVSISHDTEAIMAVADNPVSYTHLDVYKRQGQMCSRTCRRESGIRMPFPGQLKRELYGDMKRQDYLALLTSLTGNNL